MEHLTEEQRTKWAIDGYLHLPQVLSPEEVDFFSKELDRIRQEPGWEPSPDGPLGHYAWLDHAVDQDLEGYMDRRDLLSYHQTFIELMDRPSVFDLIVDIMGPYVLLSMTQSIVRPSRETFPGYTHTDGGEALRRIRVTESSWPLAVKALYLLTDCTAPDSGNLTVFPGSHLRRFPDKSDPPISPRSPGSAQLLGKAGDCILFPHALWHGPAPNRSGRARKTILYLRLSSAVCIPLSAFIRGSVSFAPLLPPFVVFLSKPPSPKKISKILNGLKFGPANTSAAARKKNSKKSEIFP